MAKRPTTVGCEARMLCCVAARHHHYRGSRRGNLQEYKTGALKHVYSNDTMAEYQNLGERNSLPPHAWNLASTCWQRLLAPSLVPPSESFNQAIVITGESGAGKSFQVRPFLNANVLLSIIA
jgi:hypothetical protein